MRSLLRVLRNIVHPALFRRKQALEKDKDSSAQFEHRLIKDAVEDSFFNGTVEVSYPR